MKKILTTIAIMMLTAVSTVMAQDFKLPATADIAMYQVNPRVFAPQNSLRAVADRADSIRALGVNVIWVMPIFPIGEEKGKNSPYCIKDYKAVAPEFGTVDDFKYLVKVCHEKGMAVILDWVANHTAWDHPWIKAHPEWYTHDEKADTIIHPRPFDWYDVADLNYDNYYMRKAMTDAMLFWVNEVGLDGFRCDVADGVPADFWNDAITELRRAAKPRNIVMLAEGKRPDNFTVGGFDMNYGWDYKDVLVKVWKGDSVEELFKADADEYAPLPKGKLKMRFTTNHDHATEAAPVKEFTNVRGSMAAYVASIFPHGGAMIYGSQEVGYPETINFFKYVPVNWTANPALYKEYQMLIKLYNDNTALRKGEMKAYPDHDIMLFTKEDGKQRFMVAVNVRNAKKTIAIPQELQGKVTNACTGKAKTIGKKLSMKPFEYIIVKY